MSSEKRSMTANTFDRDVPPLNTRHVAEPRFEEDGEDPAHPEVFFEHHCRHIAPGCGLLDVEPALVRGQLQEFQAQPLIPSPARAESGASRTARA